MSVAEIMNELTALAYRLNSMRNHQATTEGLKTTAVLLEAAAILGTHPDATPNDPLTLEELRKIFDGEEGPIWVVFGVVTYPAILDGYDGELVAVWSALGKDDALHERDYGKTWLAYRRRPKEEKR